VSGGELNGGGGVGSGDGSQVRRGGGGTIIRRGRGEERDRMMKMLPEP
jgi:hypothetical protein